MGENAVRYVGINRLKSRRIAGATGKVIDASRRGLFLV